jgi:S-(hydroxymethyl)glutathione dehydrogenase/alcohol dehydrogenase
MIGVTPSGTEISTRPFQLVTDWVWKGSAFGGARGRTDPPKIVDIGDLITLTTPLDKISDAFELLRRGKLIHSVVLC